MKANPGAAYPLPTAAIGFRPEFLDFRRGIHVGNLEENERITRILKLALEARYRQGFVTERWGRGVFWQWIAFLPRADRRAGGPTRGCAGGGLVRRRAWRLARHSSLFTRHCP